MAHTVFLLGRLVHCFQALEAPKSPQKYGPCPCRALRPLLKPLLNHPSRPLESLPHCRGWGMRDI